MVRLVERQLQIDGRAVEGNVTIRRAGHVHDADRPHAEVGLHAVLGHSGAADTHNDVVQERIVERPAACARQRHVEVRGACAAGDAMRHRGSAGAIGKSESQRERLRRRLEQSHVDADPREVGLRCEVHKFQWIAAARLEVHGLPHSARFSVALLALELERVRRVVHADH